jgi:hypothetical protein
MPGLPATQYDVDRAAGQVVVDLDNALAAVAAFNVMLNDADRFGGQAGLVALGYSDVAATMLINAFGDMSNLNATARGQRAQPDASDFFFWAKRLKGVTP